MKGAAGFSLIEMLAVLFVIVILTGLVTLNVNSGVSDRKLQQQVEALMAVASYAMDEAQFSGTDFGLLFEFREVPGGDRQMTAAWRQRMPQGWRPVQQGADVFTAIAFPPALQLALRLDGVDVALQNPDSESPLDDPPPQWLFTSSGETLPGELLLRDPVSGESLWRIEWDALGRFEAYRGDDVEAHGDADALAALR